MSAPDAAPLPRLGEVFFDVRGHSRSMRLSWYADTGIAVFSIWQGGRCTGTFRLPIDDLPRMIEILQRGPHGLGQAPEPARPTADDYRAAAYPGDDYPASYQGDETAAYDVAESYRPGAYYRSASAHQGGRDDEVAGSYGDTGDYEYGRPAGYDDPGGYAAQGYVEPGSYGSAAGYGNSGYDADAASHAGSAGSPDSAYWPDERDNEPDAAGHGGFGGRDLTGYDHERFAPPYLRPPAETYPNDNPGPAAGRGRGPGWAAYPGEVPGDYAERGGHTVRPRPDPGYAAGSDYRSAADDEISSRHSAGRHSSKRRTAAEPDPAAGEDQGSAAKRPSRLDNRAGPGR